MPCENHYGMSKQTRTVRIGSQAISGALGKNYIVVGVGTLSQCRNVEIGSLLDAKVFTNADAEALEDTLSNSLLRFHLRLVIFYGYNYVVSIRVSWLLLFSSGLVLRGILLFYLII